MSSARFDPVPIRTTLLTAFAMAAFAANSVLCRLALGEAAIDASSFTTVRLVSGAVALSILVALWSPRRSPQSRGSWLSAGFLFTYAVAFSFAYLSLTAGTGALILFAAVQVTMILAGLLAGERPRPLEWIGLAIAVAGLVYLVFPGLEAPSPLGAALMAGAGVAWGLYSLRGRGATDPLTETSANFLRAVPFALAVSLAALAGLHLSPAGVILAVLSGALTSGLGYVVWYAALRGLTATRAATVQLSVPPLAALGGLAFLAERLTLRLGLASLLILGGIAIATLQPAWMRPRSS